MDTQNFSGSNIVFKKSLEAFIAGVAISYVVDVIKALWLSLK